jgi:hypothetical protein
MQTWFKFLDGYLSALPIPCHGLVHASISSTTDEANNFVPVDNANFALVANIWTNTSIIWIYSDVSKLREGC